MLVYLTAASLKLKMVFHKFKYWDPVYTQYSLYLYTAYFLS